MKGEIHAKVKEATNDIRTTRVWPNDEVLPLIS